MSNLSLPSFSDILNSFNSEEENSLNGNSLAPYEAFNAEDVAWQPTSENKPSSPFDISPQNRSPEPIVGIDNTTAPQLGEELALSNTQLSPFSSSLPTSSRRSSSLGATGSVNSNNTKGELNIKDILALGRSGSAESLLPPDTSSIPSSLISFVRGEDGKPIVLFKGKPITGNGSSFGKG